MLRSLANSSKRSRSGAFWVGLGILLSRLSGLLREKIFAHYFGNSDAGDAFKAALRIPNLLQNLLGEGVLSASMIPIYVQLRSKGENQKADEFVRTLGTALFLLVSILSVGGMFLAPTLVAWITPGFEGEKAELTARLVRLFFPGMALLVMSAWCLGILNSHRKFFLSYAAPVLWNIAIIVALLWKGPLVDQNRLALWAAYGLVLGCLLQFLVQVPSVWRLLVEHKAALELKSTAFIGALKSFIPVVGTRGVVQISAYIDSILSSLLPAGSVSLISYAQTLYLLPISLFGMSVSAAELPNLSEISAQNTSPSNQLQLKLNQSLDKINFFIIPTLFAFVFFGFDIVSLLYKGGSFTNDLSQHVWWILIGSSLGLVANTQSRLYSSAFYALNNTKSPLYIVLFRLTLSTVLAYLAAFRLTPKLGIPQEYGTVALTLASAIAAWVEWWLLRTKLEHTLEVKCRPTFSKTLKLISCATLAVVCTYALSFLNQKSLHLYFDQWVGHVLRLGSFGLVFLACTQSMKMKIPR